MSRLQKFGIVLLLASLFIGLAGTAWSIYLSFAELDQAEFSGIGPVGEQISNAIIFAAGGFVGSLIAVVIFILGRPRK